MSYPVAVTPLPFSRCMTPVCSITPSGIPPSPATLPGKSKEEFNGQIASLSPVNGFGNACVRDVQYLLNGCVSSPMKWIPWYRYYRMRRRQNWCNSRIVLIFPICSGTVNQSTQNLPRFSHIAACMKPASGICGYTCRYWVT